MRRAVQLTIDDMIAGIDDNGSSDADNVGNAGTGDIVDNASMSDDSAVDNIVDNAVSNVADSSPELAAWRALVFERHEHYDDSRSDDGDNHGSVTSVRVAYTSDHVPPGLSAPDSAGADGHTVHNDADNDSSNDSSDDSSDAPNGDDALAVRTVVDDPGLLPVRMHPGDAGADLRSAESFTLEPGTRRLVHTGVRIVLGDGQLAWVTPRSGLAVKHGITIVNTPGLIDSGYRGELMVCLLNTDQEDFFVVNAGDRIAQIVVQDYAPVTYDPVGSLDETDRGSSGFGSTGKQ